MAKVKSGQISFQTTLFKINDSTIALLPKSTSSQLPSRGSVMVQGTINGIGFRTPLEPDGEGSHWLKIDEAMSTAGLRAGDNVSLIIEPTNEWIEPTVDADIKSGLAAVPEAAKAWNEITPHARWEWIRWIRATNNPATRKKHIEVACSKLKAGMRRPCCFDASMCTDFSVSKNGVLLVASAIGAGEG